ncbi:MAG: HlyD family type I secretion periplasmic adaptor subunit, partial [Comamonas sp.]
MAAAARSKAPGRLSAQWKRFERWLLDGNDVVGTHQASDLQADAQWAAGQQQAHGSRLLVWVSLATVVVLVIWASFGYIDEVVRGTGKVVPSRQIQVV